MAAGAQILSDKTAEQASAVEGLSSSIHENSVCGRTGSGLFYKK